MESGEDFMLEVSNNGSSSYITLRTWVAGTDFSNNSWKSVTVSFTSFSAGTVFRIRCDAGDRKDKVYLDDIVVAGCTGPKNLVVKKSGITTVDSFNSGTPEVKIYPNPASHYLNLSYKNYIGKTSLVSIFGINGQLLKTILLEVHDRQVQRIDMSGFPDGLYLIRIADQGNRTLKSEKVVMHEDN